MTAKAQRIETAKFLGRAGQKSMCGHCGRDLGMTYLIDIDGDEVTMGRRCAARTMGWATTRVEMEAVRVERMAELDRRRAIISAEYPVLADAAERCNYMDPAVLVREVGPDESTRLHALRAAFYEASNADYFWDETRPNYGRYGTWQEYVESHVGQAA